MRLIEFCLFHGGIPISVVLQRPREFPRFRRGSNNSCSLISLITSYHIGPPKHSKTEAVKILNGDTINGAHSISRSEGRLSVYRYTLKVTPPLLRCLTPHSSAELLHKTVLAKCLGHITQWVLLLFLVILFDWMQQNENIK